MGKLWCAAQSTRQKNVGGLLTTTEVPYSGGELWGVQLKQEDQVDQVEDKDLIGCETSLGRRG